MSSPQDKSEAHRDRMRELFRSLSASGKAQLVDSLKAQLNPDQLRALQTQLQRAPGPTTQGVRS